MEGRKHSEVEEEEEETVEVSIRVSFGEFLSSGVYLVRSIQAGRLFLRFCLFPKGKGRRKPRGSGVNELKEEGSSNQSSRGGFSLNVLRGNRVCYGGLSETIFFFERNLIGMVSNSCGEIDFFFEENSNQGRLQKFQGIGSLVRKD